MFAHAADLAVSTRTRSFILSIALFVGCLGPARAQSPDPSDPSTVFDTISSAAASISTATKSPAVSHQTLDDIQHSATLLKARYATSGTMSNEYLASLEADKEVLYRAVSSPSSPSDAADVRFVANDLSTKLTYARAQSGEFTDVLGDNIALHVITEHGGRPVNGYDVQCNPRRFARSSSSLFPFADETSPATRMLPPGIFTVDIVKNGRTVAHKDVELGLDGKATETLVVDVP